MVMPRSRSKSMSSTRFLEENPKNSKSKHSCTPEPKSRPLYEPWCQDMLESVSSSRIPDDYPKKSKCRRMLDLEIKSPRAVRKLLYQLWCQDVPEVASSSASFLEDYPKKSKSKSELSSLYKPQVFVKPKPSSKMCYMCAESHHQVQDCAETGFLVYLGICYLDSSNQVRMSDGSVLPQAEGEGGVAQVIRDRETARYAVPAGKYEELDPYVVLEDHSSVEEDMEGFDYCVRDRHRRNLWMP